jgi:hypothetical protein
METITGKLNDTNPLYIQACKHELIFSLNVEVEVVEPKILYTVTLTTFNQTKAIYATKEILYKQSFLEIKLLINNLLTEVLNDIN